MQNPLTAPIPIARTLGYLYLCIAVAALFAFSGKIDPDYEAYRFLYDSAGGYLAESERDPGFVAILGAFSERVTYEQFRLMLCAVFGLLLFKITARVDPRSVFAFALFLSPLILLKLHIQIREGLALLLWLYAVTGERRVRSISFWLLAALSCAIHFSVVVWWIAAALLMLPKRPRFRRQAMLFLAFFFIVGAATTTSGKAFLIEQTFLADFVSFGDTGFSLSRGPGMASYWALFLLVPAFTLFVFRKRAVSLQVKPWQPSIFGMLGTFGLIGFFSAVMLGLLGTTSEGDFTFSGRIAETLLILLCVHLGITRPTSAVSWMVLLFSIGHVAKQLVFREA